MPKFGGSGNVLSRCRWVRFLASRLVKVLGNLLKAPCYFHYVVFPKKRFVIPRHSKPLLSASGQSVIPRTVWQTNYTDQVTMAVYLNFLFNRLISPTYEFKFMDDVDADEFVKTNFPSEEWTAYSKLQIGAARADFWRVLVLQKFGGVYLDIDSHVVWPLEFIIGRQDQELYLEHKNGAFFNYFLASKSDNPNLVRLIEVIVHNVKTMDSCNNVYALTGPAVFNTCLRNGSVPTSHYTLTCYQGTFTNEFFQYIDSPQSKWHKAQRAVPVVKR